MRRLLPLALVALACNQNPINTPIRSFDRPSDVALACARWETVGGALQWNALPLSSCGPNAPAGLTVTDPVTGAPIADATAGVKGPQLRALVANSARGELALVDLTNRRISDLDPRNPGFGFVPVGAVPEHVRAAPDGCVAVTTNAGSCDLARVDLPGLYNGTQVAPPAPDGGAGELSAAAAVRRLVPTVGGVPLGARPSWIELAPENSAGTAQGGICAGGSYRAWVALPGCALVVEVDLDAAAPDAQGRYPAEVRRAVRFGPAGAEVITDPSGLSCPAECPRGPAADAGLSDAGAGDLAAADGGAAPAADGGADGGAARLPTTQAMPTTLAVDTEGGAARLFIGDGVGERIVILPLDAAGAPGAPRTVTLEPGALGVQVVRVSHRTQSGKFLYAVARDATVRVVDLDREVECETNPDPRLAPLRASAEADPAPGARAVGCFPLGDPATPPRSPLATTPGLSLPGGALPKDVAFVHVDVRPRPNDPLIEPPRASPGLLVGDFAWIVGSDGRATVVNVYDACPQPNVTQQLNGTYTPSCALANADASRAATAKNPGPPVPLVLDRVAHRLRGQLSRFGTPVTCDDPAAGAPRDVEPAPGYTASVNGTPVGMSAADTASGAITLASLPALVTEALPPDQASQCQAFRAIAPLDPDRVRRETWTVAWEGTLPGTQRALGVPGKSAVAGAALFVDAGAAFCSRGVRRGDKLQLLGCEKDEDCDFRQACVRDPAAPTTVQTGLCLPKGDATLAAACSPLLRSVRRYRITSAKQRVPLGSLGGEITDALELAEIAEPEHADDTIECGADPSICRMVTVKGVDAKGESVTLPTACLPDWDGQMRCLRACDSAATGERANDALCSEEFLCLPSRLGGERCLRAPLDDALFDRCLNELQRYEIHVGEAFLVSGSETGAPVEGQPNPVTRECEIPPVSAPYVQLRQPRIPITIERHAGGADTTTLPRCPAERSSPIDPLDPGFPSNVCLATPVAHAGDRVIHFEHPLFAFAITLPKGRAVPPDTTALSFRVAGNPLPVQVALGIDVQALQPRAAVVGPDRQSVYVIDEGKQSVPSGLRGQLLRLSSQDLAVDRGLVIR